MFVDDVERWVEWEFLRNEGGLEEGIVVVEVGYVMREEVVKKGRVLWGGEKMGCMIGGMELGNGKCVIVDSGRKEVDLECIEGLKKKVKI